MFGYCFDVPAIYKWDCTFDSTPCLAYELVERVFCIGFICFVLERRYIFELFGERAEHVFFHELTPTSCYKGSAQGRER